MERTLEGTVDDVRKRYPGCQIELALSGGRKGMATLAMFVAQRKGIRYVYHTLIIDKQLSEKVERETSISALRGTQVSKQVRLQEKITLRRESRQGSLQDSHLRSPPTTLLVRAWSQASQSKTPARRA